MDRERRGIARPRKALAAVIQRLLNEWKSDAVHAAKSLAKAADPDEVKRVLAAIHLDHYAAVMGDIEPLLEEIGQDAGVMALAQVGIRDDESLTELTNDFAVDYATERAAEMVGMRYNDDGELETNPNPEWAIDDATRDMLRDDVVTAMDEGLSNDALADKIAGSYAFSEERAQTIARTETAFADVAGNLNAYRESGEVASKQWVVSEECCDECAELDGEIVALDDDFPNDGGDGPPLHPNCFSGEAVVTAVGVSAYFKRRFRGEVVVISGAGIDDLTVTPNHPVLTPRGWVAVGDLKVNDELLYAVNPRSALAAIYPNDDQVQARFEDVAAAAFMAGGVTAHAVPLTAEHFHGDAAIDDKVDVVWPAGALRIDLTERQQSLAYCALCGGELGKRESGLTRGRSGDKRLSGPNGPANGGVSGSGEALALTLGSLRHAQDHRLTSVTNREAHPLPSLAKGAAMAMDAPSEINARLSGDIAPVKVTRLVRREFNGHVFNLETKMGWYFANGIIAHNCRCDVLPVLTDHSETDTEGDGEADAETETDNSGD